LPDGLLIQTVQGLAHHGPVPYPDNLRLEHVPRINEIQRGGECGVGVQLRTIQNERVFRRHQRRNASRSVALVTLPH